MIFLFTKKDFADNLDTGKNLELIVFPCYNIFAFHG